MTQSVAEFFRDEGYNQRDLKHFFAETNLKQQTVDKIIGPYFGEDHQMDPEANMDIQ